MSKDSFRKSIKNVSFVHKRTYFFFLLEIYILISGASLEAIAVVIALTYKQWGNGVKENQFGYNPEQMGSYVYIVIDGRDI